MIEKKEYKKSSPRVIQSKNEGSQLNFADNRANAITQAELINTIQKKGNKAELFNGKQTHPSIIQRSPKPVKIIWDTTHIVKKMDGSIFGKGNFEDGEIQEVGELKNGQIVEIDDKKRFISRRGPNQEDPENREYDRKRIPCIEWFRVLKLNEKDTQSEELYIRNGTFIPVDDDRSCEERVKAALTIATKDLSKDLIMASLHIHFATYPGGLLTATKTEIFSKTLLEEIRKKQSRKWVNATKMVQAVPKTWTNDDQKNWSIRHYTNKVSIKLGKEIAQGVYSVQSMKEPPFREILSSITLSTPGSSSASPVTSDYKEDSEILVANTASAGSSGHTTPLDWSNIGNVGDTFYALFYGNAPVTGLTPGFIKDATFYAQWDINEFGVGWASSDWLSQANESKKDDGETPRGEAVEGYIPDIIAHLYPDAPTRKLTADSGKETKSDEESRKEAFLTMSNFEIKKHGSMTVKEWIEVEENVDKFKKYFFNSKNGTFYKGKNFLPKEIKDKIPE